jgi:hypothetical protein
MGLRGFVLVKLQETPDHERLWEITKGYEKIQGIEFASRVIGEYDYVLSVDTQKPMERIIEQVKRLCSGAEAVGLTIDETYGKHRELRDLKLFEDLAQF